MNAKKISFVALCVLFFIIGIVFILVVKLDKLERFGMESSEFSFVLKPSSLEGIGVFATHDIPAGTLLFNKSFDLRVLKMKDIPKDLLPYCIFINDQDCLCPERFDRMEIGWYINHSSTPNIAKKTTVSNDTMIGDIKKRTIYAIKDIKAGDEILIDFNYLDEPEHLKKSFYKK